MKTLHCYLCGKYLYNRSHCDADDRCDNCIRKEDLAHLRLLESVWSARPDSNERSRVLAEIRKEIEFLGG